MNAVSSIKTLRPGEGEALWAMGEKFTFKVGPEDTGGAFTLAEILAQPRNGPPPHRHQREDELFFVVDGEFDFLLGNRAFRCSNGSAVYLPRNVLHTYTNAGQRPGKLLVIASPCGFEEFIRSWGCAVVDPSEGPPMATQADIDKLMAAAAAFGIEIRPDAKSLPDNSRPAPEPSRWVLGQFVTIKLTSRETSGQFSVVEVISPPGPGVPNHVHGAMDEVFYVLEGAVNFTLGDHLERVEAGGLVFVPRGELHGFANAGQTPSRLLDVHTPGGFEAFFEEAGVPATAFSLPAPSGPLLNKDQLVSLFRKHGMEIPMG